MKFGANWKDKEWPDYGEQALALTTPSHPSRRNKYRLKGECISPAPSQMYWKQPVFSKVVQTALSHHKGIQCISVTYKMLPLNIFDWRFEVEWEVEENMEGKVTSYAARFGL